MPLDNVPRIAAPPADEFFREWVLPRRPVILTDLFDGAPIRAIDRIDLARQALGAIELEIQPNYLVFLQGRRGERRRERLADYLAHVAAEPRTRDLCAEFATPPALRALLPPVPYCELRDPADVVSATFLANAGNYAHLHVDTDQRDVLLYQVFGEKRFALVQPEYSRRLDAYLTFDPATRAGLGNVPAYEGNGRAFLHEIPSPALLDAFLAYVHASDTVLRPGETLYMPALVWHYVEYRDTSLSITYRLGRNRYNRALAELLPYPSTFLQTVGARVGDERRFAAEHPDLAEALDAALFGEHASDEARAEAANAFVLRAFERLTSDSPAAVAAAREIFRQSALRG